jgi:hypothetical protein
LPNHVQQRFTIFGPARDVATFVMQSQRPRPKTGDQPEWVAFDFHGVVPLPPEYALFPYSDVGYDLERVTWGTKWGPYAFNPATDMQVQEHRADYQYETAWGIPQRYYEQASLAFPQCTLVVSWSGEGPTFGRVMYCAGNCLLYEEGDWNALSFCEQAGTEEEEEIYQQAQDVYLRTHAEFVEALLSNSTLEILP